jgi:hypothetical protein
MRIFIALIAVAVVASGCMTVPIVVGTRNTLTINDSGKVDASPSADGGSKMGMPNLVGE